MRLASKLLITFSGILATSAFGFALAAAWSRWLLAEQLWATSGILVLGAMVSGIVGGALWDVSRED